MKQKYCYTVKMDPMLITSTQKLKSVIEITPTKKQGIYEILVRGKYLKEKTGLKILKVKMVKKKVVKKKHDWGKVVMIASSIASVFL